MPISRPIASKEIFQCLKNVYQNRDVEDFNHNQGYMKDKDMNENKIYICLNLIKRY
ncbi:unnamed protein product [Paramecium primaurelia]|uniref:Uncharacterized protein n=1 Tax=Paramecium primaurelia TaxID=5886 RepID=A0A8S1QQN5_PARPR|nr:unnamed protein product [Paramecium primaurelia]